MAARFSKNAMVLYLSSMATMIEDKYGFDPHNGWAQVDGKGEELNREYGEYRAYLNLIESIQSGSVAEFAPRGGA